MSLWYAHFRHAAPDALCRKGKVTPTPTDKYADWVTKSEAAKILNTSERTLERLIAQKQVRQAHRRVPGRRAMTVLHPDDIEQLRSVTVQPTALEQPEEESVPGVNALTRVAQMFAQYRVPASSAAPLSPHRFLSLEEASAYIGLPAAYLQLLVKRGELPAVKVRGMGSFVRPRDLDAL